MKVEDAAYLSIACSTAGEHRTVTTIEPVVRKIAAMVMDAAYRPTNMLDESTMMDTSAVASQLNFAPASTRFFDVVVSLLEKPGLDLSLQPTGSEVGQYEISLEFPAVYALLRIWFRRWGEGIQRHRHRLCGARTGYGTTAYKVSRSLNHQYFQQLGRRLFD